MMNTHDLDKNMFRAIADYSYDWESWVGTDGMVRWINPAIERITGYSVEECLAMPDYPFPLIAEDDCEEMRLIFMQALQGGSGNDHPFRIRRKDGVTFWGAISWQPLYDPSGRCLGYRTSVRDITYSLRAQQVGEHNVVLAHLFRRCAFEGDLNELFQEIIETSSQVMSVARVGIWLFDETCKRIVCQALYERAHHVHSAGMALSQADYPAYFQALRSEQAIAAEDAHSDPRTREFSLSYLTPLGIGAMLDAPIWAFGQLAGVICHEHIGLPRRWSQEERAFANSAAFCVAIALESQERRRKEQDQRLAATFFKYTSEAIVICDTHRQIVTINPAFTRITGYTPEECTGRDPTLLIPVDQEPERDQAIWDEVQRQGFWEGEVQRRHKNGRVFPAFLRLNAVKDATGVVTHYLGLFRDITEFKAQQERLEYLANYDGLTGLANRSLFYNRLHHALERAKRGDERVAIVFIDLDNFKYVNDSLGHAAGDRLLQKVADRLRESVRAEDTLCRFGGDEFVLLIEGVHDAEQTARTAERIIESLRQPVASEGEDLFVAVSVGIALFPNDGQDVETLVRNADTAMYKAKEGGKSTYRFFTAAMNQEVFNRLSLETRLRRAIEREELSLLYQPILEIPSGRLAGLEALLRWRCPVSGMVEPDQFIPVAEQSGLIIPIGEWALRAACRQSQLWAETGMNIGRIAVNLSLRQCQQKGLATMVARALHDAGLAGSSLELELTESAMMHERHISASTLEVVNSMGVHIVIDDFGTGYSSLALLKRFPVDRIKIDRTFVRDLTIDPDDAAIITAVISLAHSLGIAVVAEGVERPEQLELLQMKGCDFVQGWYISPPLSQDEVAAWIGRLSGAANNGDDRQ